MPLSILIIKVHSCSQSGLTGAQVHLAPESCSTPPRRWEGQGQRERLERIVPFAIYPGLPKKWEHHKLDTSVTSCTKVAPSVPGDHWLVLQKSIAEAVLLLVPDLPGDLSTLHKTSKDETSSFLARSFWAFIRAHVYQVLQQISFKSSVSFLLCISKNYACSSNQAAKHFYLALPNLTLPLILRHLKYRHYQSLELWSSEKLVYIQFGKQETPHAAAWVISLPPAS